MAARHSSFERWVPRLGNGDDKRPPGRVGPQQWQGGIDKDYWRGARPVMGALSAAGAVTLTKMNVQQGDEILVSPGRGDCGRESRQAECASLNLPGWQSRRRREGRGGGAQCPWEPFSGGRQPGALGRHGLTGLRCRERGLAARLG